VKEKSEKVEAENERVC